MTAWQKDWILSDPACQENAPQPGGDCGATGSIGFFGGRTRRSMFWLIDYSFSHICQAKNAIQNDHSEVSPYGYKFGPFGIYC
jgi:phosphoribosyl 1,2-cyclic phosphodiesterase